MRKNISFKYIRYQVAYTGGANKLKPLSIAIIIIFLIFIKFQLYNQIVNKGVNLYSFQLIS